MVRNRRWWSLVPVAVLVGLALIDLRGHGEEPRTPNPALIRETRPDQEKIAKRKEHCAVDPTRLSSIGRTVGQQVRVSRLESEFAIFTVAETSDEDPDSIVRMGRFARLRLGSSAEFDGSISARAILPNLTEVEAKARGELAELVEDDGRNTGLLILAPHGGEIESSTDLQADRLASRIGKPGRVSTWKCLGYHPRGGKAAFDRWHITSTDIHEASYPGLARVSSRKFDHAVSFHGMIEDRVLVGGAAPTRLRLAVRDAIREALAGTEVVVVVDIAMPGDSNGGKDPKNIVNRYAPGGGIQIEQSPRARRDHWQAIADAVARVLAPKL